MKKSEGFYLLQNELKPYFKALIQASEAILETEVSKYPILVVYQQESIEMGVPVINKKDVKGKWSINASTLEEFAMKQVIQTDKIEDFQGIYKDPNHHLCLFVLSELGAQFIFLDRTKIE